MLQISYLESPDVEDDHLLIFTDQTDRIVDVEIPAGYTIFGATLVPPYVAKYLPSSGTFKEVKK